MPAFFKVGYCISKITWQVFMYLAQIWSACCSELILGTSSIMTEENQNDRFIILTDLRPILVMNTNHYCDKKSSKSQEFFCF